MSAKILEGKFFAQKFREEAGVRADALRENLQIVAEYLE